MRNWTDLRPEVANDPNVPGSGGYNGEAKTRQPVSGPLDHRANGWDVEEDSEELQAFIEFERNDSGQFQFGCVHGQMDCRLTQRDGQSAVEFSWDGNDDTEHAFGRGWAVLESDRLNGMIFFHLGDESGFTARM